MSTFQTENPLNFEPLATYNYHTPAEIEAAIQKAVVRAREWRWTAAEAKASQLRHLGVKLREQKEIFALTMAMEMGKPLKEGRSEVEKCAATCDYYAGRVRELTAGESIHFDGKTNRIVREPMGLVLAVMPWNFPLWQVLRSVVPIIVGGNAYILKHSDSVAGTAEMLEAVCNETFGSGLVTNLRMTHDQVAALIGDSRIRGITMTGSSAGGAKIAEVSGRHLKKCLLELGGSDPVLVLEDADVELAASVSVQSRLINAGQSCISAKRFLIPENLWTAFIQKMSEKMNEAVLGSPLEEATTIGPLAHRRFAEKARLQLETIQKEGAKVLWQKEMKELRGAFVRPMMLLAGPAQPSYLTEEFFAPIALVTKYSSVEEGIQLANATSFGLGATIIAADPVHAENLAARLEAGVVAINQIVASDPHLPFGGIKDSGFGRELSGQGVMEFQSIKSILIDNGSARKPGA